MSLLSTNLREGRERKKLTIEDVSVMAGVPEEMIEKLEAGLCGFPEPHDLFYLAKAYGIDYIALMIEAGHIKYKKVQPEGAGILGTGRDVTEEMRPSMDKMNRELAENIKPPMHVRLRPRR